MKTIAKIIAAVMLMSAAPLAAQGANPVTLAGDVMAVEVSQDEAGNEVVRLVEPAVIVPGDRLVFGTDFANTGAEAVENFVVTNPLPAAVRLAPDADPELVVSVDAGANWGKLEALTVTGDDGSSLTATHEDVTHVRWTLASIAPGQTGRLEYPAIIR